MVRGLGVRSAGRVEPPDTAGLVALQGRNADHSRKSPEFLIVGVIDTLEEASVPLAAFRLLDLAKLALGVLDLRLGHGHGIHIAPLDACRNVAPCPPALIEVLLVDGRQSQRGGLRVLDRESIHLMLAGVFDDEGIRPLSVNSIQRLLLALVFLEKDGTEGVLLATQPALARVVNLRHVASAAGNASRLLQFDKRRSVDKGFNVQVREGDQVPLLLRRIVLIRTRRSEGQQGMSDLFDLDGAGEGCLLGIVSLELQCEIHNQSHVVHRILDGYIPRRRASRSG